MNNDEIKVFLLGLTSAFLASVIWDYYKKHVKIYEFEE